MLIICRTYMAILLSKHLRHLVAVHFQQEYLYKLFEIYKMNIPEFICLLIKAIIFFALP